MKKNHVIKSLITVGLIAIVWFHSPLVLAEELRESLKDSSESKIVNKTIEEVVPTAIEIISEKTVLDVDENLTLTTKIIPENSTKTVTWTTSDESIATVSDSGIVTGIKAGVVSITANTSNEKNHSISLTITEKKEAVTGTFGTVPWTWEAETQTLAFGEGEFPETKKSTNILTEIENSVLLKENKIKQITFTKPVIANKNSSYLFNNLKDLKSIIGLELLETSNVTDMSYMFYDASSLTTLDVSKWDTSNVTSMLVMFRGARSLIALDISKWDTSNVTNMAHMFYSTSSLTALDVSKWSTSNVTDMSAMFGWTTSLTVLDVSFWDTSSVTSMYGLFLHSSSLTTLDISKWNTSNVTNMAHMFYSTSSLTALDVSKWDTHNVTNMYNMFAYATSLKILDVSMWDTRNVTNMAFMFRSKNNLTTLDVSMWDTGNVKDMSGMFYYKANLTALDVSNWDTSKVTNMAFMFSYADKLTTLDVSMWDTSNVTDMSYMFNHTRSLTTLDVSKWNVSNVSSMSSMFSEAYNLTTVDMSQWDTRNVEKMDQAFASSHLLDTLILGENTLLKSDVGLTEKSLRPNTGKWILVSPDTQNSYSSSEDLMANYDGTKPGKYVREKIGDSTKVTGIKLTPPTVELTVSEEATLQAKITPATASNKKVSYTTSDNSVATVSTNGVVKGIKKGTAVITATTEDGNFQVTSTVTVVDQSAFLIDLFYLGIDDYVTGSVDTSLSAKKVQLVINDEVITTSTLARDGSFELDTEDRITKITDKVEVVALDRKNNELERATVAIEEKSYALNVNPYTLYVDATITGQTDYFHTHVALMINGEEVERKLLTSTRKFSFDVEGLIDYADDEVEVVGYRYEEEITRKEVTIKEPTIEMVLSPYKVDEPYVTGKVTGKSASTVRLYVNRRRQQTVKVGEDGTFNLLGVAILSPTDKVEIAVLNDAGIEIQRFAVTVTN